MYWIYYGAAFGMITKICYFERKFRGDEEKMGSFPSFIFKILCSTFKWAAVFGFFEYITDKLENMDNRINELIDVQASLNKNIKYR